MTEARARAAAPLVLIVIVSAVALPTVWPLTSLGTASHDSIDAHLFLWEFWWTRHAAEALQSLFSTSLLLHPNGASLAFASYPLPYSIASIPFQAALPGLTGLVVAFNAIVLASFLLSGLAAYALSARLTGHRLAALVAGLVFACMPYRLMNVARLHVLATEFLAAFVLAWIWFLEAPSYRRAGVLGVAAALLYYSSPEYALHATGFVAIWLAFSWRRLGSPGVAGVAGQLAAAAAISLVLVAPLLVAQIRALSEQRAAPVRTLTEATEWSPALLSFVTPSRQHPVYGEAFSFAGEYDDGRSRGMRSETTVALTAIALALIGAIRSRRDKTLPWVVSAAAFFVLALGPYLRVTGTWLTGVPLPYLVLYHAVPPLQIARDPTRLVPMAMLAMSVLAAFGFRACAARFGTPRAALAFAIAVVALIPFESLTGWPAKTAAASLLPAAYARLSQNPGSEAAVIDLTGDHQAMLAQTEHGRPITAGHVADPRSAAADKMLYVETDLRDPRWLASLDPTKRDQYVAADRDMLAKYGIRFLVAPESAVWVEPFAQLLGFDRVVSGGVAVYERR